MKIGFLLCSADISGGTNVILEHGGGLRDLGHEVSIITRQQVGPDTYGWHPKGEQLRWVTAKDAREMTFDCLIATWWESPYLLHLFDSTHYVYFIQSIESRFFQDEDLESLDLRDHTTGVVKCEHSYYFSLPIITEATWIKEYLETQCNQRPSLVRNGIRKELYDGNSVISEKPVDGLRVLIEGPVDVFHKNVPETIALCRRAGVAEIWLLTSSDVEAVDGVDRVFSRVRLEQTPHIYRSCHVLVKLSLVEGMFGPPLEMFHCGGTAVVYNVSGHDEYIEHGVNGLVAESGDEQQVIAYLEELNADPTLLQRLCRGAEQTALQWHDWEEAAAGFERALMDLTQETPVCRSYLENVSRIFNTHQALQLESRELERHAARESDSEQVDSNNFVQFYTLSDSGIVDHGWTRYLTGSRTVVSGRITVHDRIFQVRVDPSVRIGIVSLYRIVLRNQEGGELVSYSPADFDRLFVTGSARWVLELADGRALHSYGNDPQIILPVIEAEPGQELILEISLSEMGIGRFIREIGEGTPQGVTGKGLFNTLRKIVGP